MMCFVVGVGVGNDVVFVDGGGVLWLVLLSMLMVLAFVEMVVVGVVEFIAFCCLC